MTLNRDLFGNFIPEPATETPVSIRPRKNTVRVYHGSWKETPPHEVEGDIWYQPTDNVHPDIIHAGTPAAAVHRTHIHEYEIDLSHPDVSGVTWGDSPLVLQSDKDYELIANDEPEWWSKGSRLDHFNKRMSGVKEGLFENTSADVLNAAQKGTVLPYRNRREDSGSISYAIPKSAVGGAVKYIGAHEGKEFREKHVYGQ